MGVLAPSNLATGGYDVDSLGEWIANSFVSSRVELGDCSSVTVSMYLMKVSPVGKVGKVG